jgi:hypothetical protein
MAQSQSINVGPTIPFSQLGIIYRLPQNTKVSDGSQPPVTFDLALSESAGSGSLGRLVRTNSIDRTLRPP